MSGQRRRRRQRRPVGGGDRRTAGCSSCAATPPRAAAISLKGADIVVARIGRAHDRLHGPDGPPRDLRRRGRGARATRSTRRGSTCAARSPGSARTASRSRCATSTSPRSRELLERGRHRAASEPGDVPALRLGARRCTTGSPSTTHRCCRCETLRESARSTATSIAEIQRAAARRDLRDPRLRRQARAPALRRPGLPRRERLALSARGLSRALRHERRRSARGYAKRPIELDIPITIAGMSFGALSAPAKEALGRGRDDGRHLDDDRRRRHDRRGARASSKTLVYQCLPSRYGLNPDDLRRADAIEIVIGQGAKPGGGGMLLGPEDLRARGRDARPAGRASTSAAPAGIPTGPGRTTSRSRSRSCARSPTGRCRSTSRSAPSRTYYDVELAVKAGADVVVLDGMQGGTAATQDVFIEHVGIPTLAAIRPPSTRSRSSACTAQVQLIVSGGIRTGADVAKALALGADAVVDRRRRADRARRQQPGARRRATTASAPPRASTTPGTRVATPPASPRRTRSSPRGSTPRPAAARLANYLRVLTMSRRRPSPAPAASRTSTTSSPRTSSRSPSRPRPWRACRWPGRTGSLA